MPPEFSILQPDDDDVTPRASLPGDAEDADDPAEGDVWLDEDLEQAYQQALEAVEAAEAEAALLAPNDSADTEATDRERPPDGASPQPDSTKTPEGGADLRSAPLPSLNCLSAGPNAPRVQPRQIIEAALFVGGMPLTTKRLSSLLRGEFDADFIEAAIDELNQLYAEQNRPYEIRFGEGGFRLVLKPEFERLSHRVYGLGPKEVKLSQEALEVLALVAYQQPISAKEIEELGKPRPSAILGQLLRRELIAIDRGEDHRRKNVKYRTTPRFLQLFGLGDLDELPQADELNFK